MMQSETKASQARKEHDFMEKQAMAQSVDKNRVADLIIEAVEHNFRDSGHKNKTYRNCIEKLVKCSKCGALMMPHRVCKACGSYNKKEIVSVD
jgi:large subunit ribosomal protein L32